MCQECIDEHPDAARLIEPHLKDWPDAEWGPGHIVFSDYNLEDGHITWCRALIRAALSGDTSTLTPGDIEMLDRVDWYRDHDGDEMAASDAVLAELLQIPEDQR